jgi:hypothetical protein
MEQYSEQELAVVLRTVRSAVMAHFGGIAVHQVTLLSPGSVKVSTLHSLSRSSLITITITSTATPASLLILYASYTENLERQDPPCRHQGRLAQRRSQA